MILNDTKMGSFHPCSMAMLDQRVAGWCSPHSLLTCRHSVVVFFSHVAIANKNIQKHIESYRAYKNEDWMTCKIL